MIVPTANYPTSRDYGRLWELAHTAAIVCIVDMEHGKPGTCRDIARSVHSPEWSPELVQVGSRGIGHVWAESLEAFIAGCEQCNLEWLVPPAALAQPEGEGPSDRIVSIAKAVQECAFAHESDARLIGNVCAEDVADLCDAALACWGRPPAPAAPEHAGGSINDEQREAVCAAVTEALGNAYDCLRVWCAWGVGTMGPDDFVLVADDDDRVAEIADAAIEAMRPTALPAPAVGDGPSLADVDELCAEFGFHYDDTQGESLEILQEMVAAAITRWRAPAAQPAAQPVDVANLMRLTEGVDPFAPGDPDPDHIERLAEIIRGVDGKHELGATILAERILAHPGFSGCHDGPAPAPAVVPVAVAERLPVGEGPSAAELLPVDPPNIPTTMAMQYRSAWREGVEDGWAEARAALARWSRPAAPPAPQAGEVEA
jgi:hypothetical protein